MFHEAAGGRTGDPGAPGDRLTVEGPWEGEPVEPSNRGPVRGVLLAATLATLTAIAAACTAAPSVEPPAPTVEAAPPAPPAACLLDTTGLAAASGLTWTPDQTTASDTRCVYDPARAGTPEPEPEPTAGFLTVAIAPVAAGEPGDELDRIAAVCQDGSRAAVPAGGTGFVCRFRGGSVLAALVRAGQLVTVSASAVPQGTTAAQLVIAMTQQLETLSR